MRHVIISIAVLSGLATSVARAEDIHVAKLLICVGETTDRMVRQLKAAGLTPRGKELEVALVKAGAHSCTGAMLNSTLETPHDIVSSQRLLANPDYWGLVTNEVRKVERYEGITPAGPVQDFYPYPSSN